MGVKLYHLLGILLIAPICCVIGYSANADLDKNDTEVNQINKLQNTNEYTPSTRTTESISPKTNDDKENVITQESNSDREDSARAIDIRKFLSPEFQNNVFNDPVGSSTTAKNLDYSNSELTTPKSRLFDKRYEEARQKLEQEFEENGQDGRSDSSDDEEEEESNEASEDEDLHLEKTAEEVGSEPNATLVDYKEQINISRDNVIEKNSNQNSFTIEKVKKVHFFSNFNDTSTFKYDTKDKSTTLMKPTENNNSHILSNKIESETIKAIPSEATTEKQKLEDKVEHKEQLVEESKIISLANLTTEAATTEGRQTTVADFGTTTVTEEGTTDFASTVTETPQLTTDVVDENITSTTLEATTISTTNSTEDETSTSSTTEEATSTEQVASSTESVQTTTVNARVSKGIPLERTQPTEIIDTTTVTTEPSTSTNGAATTEYHMVTTTEQPETSTMEQQETTTEEQTETTTTGRPDSTTASGEEIAATNPLPETTVEFIHVETRDNHTTLVPDILSPSLSYPTTTNGSADSQRAASEATTATGTTEESGETAESSASTEEATVDNPDDRKGRIIAIAISSVGAVCLILLAGLLYVMRKRQSRFNYKQRCRPVNLDDYSVDNISVYNSVRRKADRQSKRSYGNPAFEDPVAVTHPLNYPALAKFASNVEDIRAEFEEIPQISAKSSELPEGCETKNRYANVIPLPETRVFLRPIDGYPNSDYINANFVTGPKNTRGYYIATQAPMEATVDDFWRMVWEQQSKVILMITHLFENGVEKCFDYLPPSEVLDCHRLFGDYQVTLKKRDVKEKYVISSLQLKNMVSNSWRDVTHFWYLGWPEKGVPSEGNSLIAFLIEARSFMKSYTLDKSSASNGTTNSSSGSEVNPVVVHCSPGTGRTGVAVACDVAIRDFEQTRLVDIPKIVYRIRRDRASAVQTKEQYMFIYKVVSLYATKLTGGSLDSFENKNI